MMVIFYLYSDTISQFNVLVKGQEDDIGRLKVATVCDKSL